MNILQDEELSPEEVASTGEDERETSPTATPSAVTEEPRSTTQAPLLASQDLSIHSSNVTEETQAPLYDVHFTPRYSGDCDEETGDTVPPAEQLVPVMDLEREREGESLYEQEDSDGGEGSGCVGETGLAIPLPVDSSRFGESGQHYDQIAHSELGHGSMLAQTSSDIGHNLTLSESRYQPMIVQHSSTTSESSHPRQLSHSPPSLDRTLRQHETAAQTLSESQAGRGLDTSSQSSAVSSPIPTPTVSSQTLSKELGVSPYVVVKRDSMMDVGQFESPGLLYARSMKEKHNLDMLRPADEVAEDVLEMIPDEDHDTATRHHWLEEEDEEDGASDDDDRGERGAEGEGGERDRPRKKSRSSEGKARHKVSQLELDASLNSLESPGDVLDPLDPTILRDLERQARKVASSLEYIMDNLHNSLHAMTVCAKQSVMLHKEAVDNLHSVVDANVKATYSFLAKFEELKNQTVPLNDLAQQIKDVDKVLKVFERNFRTP